MQFVSGGGHAFNAMLYGEQSMENRAFFQNQLERMQSLQFIGDIGSQVMQSAHNLFERWNGSKAMQIARAVTRQVTSLFQPDQVRTLFEMADFQAASLEMQRWIMANPAIRQRYHEQRLEGYADTYVDNEPDKVGEDHQDWRMVNDGVVKVSEDGWKVVHYLEPLRKGDKRLSPSQKVSILTTWDIAEMFLAQEGADPTSQYNSNL